MGAQQRGEILEEEGERRATESAQQAIVRQARENCEHERILGEATQHGQHNLRVARQLNSAGRGIALGGTDAEQHEEEKLFKSILDRIEIIGTDGTGLFYIDRELAQLAGAKQAAEDTA